MDDFTGRDLRTLASQHPKFIISEIVITGGLDGARAYVQHSRNTLTCVNLMHCSFSLHDLGMLLDLLGIIKAEESDCKCPGPEPSSPGHVGGDTPTTQEAES